MHLIGMIGLLAMHGPAHATEALLRYDNSTGAGDAFLPFGEYGLLMLPGECAVTVYEAEPEEYPIRPVRLQVLLGGDGGELLVKIHMWSAVEVINASVMDASHPDVITLIDRERFLFRDVEPEGTLVEVDLIEEAHMKDVLIEEGTVAIGICPENNQFTPAVMMDMNGFVGEDGDTADGYMSGNRHMIGPVGAAPWASLYDYTYNPRGPRYHEDYPGQDITPPAAPWDLDGDDIPEAFPGDFVMRLVVETNATPGGTELDSTTEAFEITPALQEEGSSVTVLIRGAGLEEGVSATIGTHPLTAIAVTNTGACTEGACCVPDEECVNTTKVGCDGLGSGTFFTEGVSCMSETLLEFETASGEPLCELSTEPGTCAHVLNGNTDSEMTPGVYDVTLTTPSGGTALLQDAFTVEEKKGCGCSTGGGLAQMWWLGLAAIGWRRRRS